MFVRLSIFSGNKAGKATYRSLSASALSLIPLYYLARTHNWALGLIIAFLFLYFLLFWVDVSTLKISFLSEKKKRNFQYEMVGLIVIGIVVLLVGT